jgi:phosphoglycerol transferase MdoB-like AlkP superfamily enzyme
MFRRDDWYARLGFGKEIFEPELEERGLPNCPGAFPGICDTAVPKWIGNEILSTASSAPKFVYWVTLNSHIPVPAHVNLPADGICKSRADLQGSNALCSWFRLVRAVHESVQQLALEPTGRPTIFVVVGDHAPPFANPRNRVRFSETRVPFVILVPKALSRASRPVLRRFERSPGGEAN